MAHLIKLTAEQEMDFLISWATQTIAVCVSVASNNRPDDGELQVEQARDTSHSGAIALELWRDALAQCGSLSEDAGATFVHNVLRWCDRTLADA